VHSLLSIRAACKAARVVYPKMFEQWSGLADVRRALHLNAENVHRRTDVLAYSAW